MKKILAVLTIAGLVACGGGESETDTSGDNSMQRAADSAQLTGDTSSMNQPMGDSTSASGIHGAGSGSRVGGGKTGAPQERSGNQ
jgi:hypothetical protein